MKIKTFNVVKKPRKGKFTLKNKKGVGLFIATFCNEHGISPKLLAEYTGFNWKSLNRLMKEERKLTLNDFLWVVHSLGELSGVSNGLLLHLALQTKIDTTFKLC